MSITRTRMADFASDLLRESGAKIVLADVGSGGDLKEPWSILPESSLEIMAFEPTGHASPVRPLCISDRSGPAMFNVAVDERASSFHQPNTAFIERFAQQSLMVRERIEVDCTTLDDTHADSRQALDAVDVNVEGHDLCALKGGAGILENGNIKLLKVEFELTEVWLGNSRFGEIEQFLRSFDYELVDLEFDRIRPVNVRHIYCKGEPVWGKAYFAASAKRWERNRDTMDEGQFRSHVLRGIALYICAGLPGRAMDLIDMEPALFSDNDLQRYKSRMAAVFQWHRLDEYAGLSARFIKSLVKRVLGKV